MEQEIQMTREKLHMLLEDNDLDSELVLEVSRELDELILLHYCGCAMKVMD